MPAAAFKTALGNAFSNSSSTSLVLSTTAAIAIGDLVVVRCATDNLSATTPTITVTDAGGNTYTRHIGTAVNATAAAGVAGAIFSTKATAAVSSGSGITMTLSGAVVGKAMYAESFTNADNTTRVAAVSATGTATAASAGATAAGVVAGDLVLGFIANETRAAITGDSDTTNGAWSTQVTRTGGATTAQDTGSVTAAGQYKIATAGGAQTYNVTAVAAEWVIGCVVLQASPDPAITQAAYQFFDDAGTEVGAASLAALNTAVTGNLANGDGYGVLRVRLQSTTAVAVPATDDYQLQYEKNASGSWINVTASGGVESLTYNYDISNRDQFGNLYFGGANTLTGQSIVGNGQVLTKAGFVLAKSGTPTGAMEARLYDSAGIVPGDNILATSAPGSPVGLSGTYSWLDFTFDGTFVLQNGVKYWITVTAPVGSNSTNKTMYGFDFSAGTDPGDMASYSGGWNNNGYDLCYRVYTTPAATTVLPYDNPNLTGGGATTNRLGAGTGSFVAGKISETGDVSNLGWTANNYTELVYSLKLIAADLANGDVLRFRVLRNGATTQMTYTVTPTINIIRTPPNVGSASGNDSWVPAAVGKEVAKSPATTSWTMATTAVGAQPLPPPPFPATGLQLWLDAADSNAFVFGTGNQVTQWRDKSGTGHHGVLTATPPTRVTGAINGLPVVQMAVDVGDSLQTTCPSDYPQSSMFAVVKRAALDNGNPSIIGDNLGGGFSWDVSGGQIRTLKKGVYGIGGANTALNPDEVALIGTDFDGLNWNHYRNGAVDGTGQQPSHTGFTAGTQVVIGGYQPATANWSWAGQFAEIIKYDRVLSRQERAQVESYLALKWGTPWTPLTSGAVGWWDADDVSTFTFRTGDIVTQWRDKSGGNHHAEHPYPANNTRPTRDVTINARDAIKIELPNQGLDWTYPTLFVQPFAAAFTEGEVFMALQVTEDNSGAYHFKWGANTSGLWSHYTAGGVIYDSWGSASRHAIGDPTPELTAPHIYNLRSAPNLYEGAINGTVLYTTTSNTVGFGTAPYEIPMGGNGPIGKIGEYIVFDRVLTLAERTKVEQYLTAKWIPPPVVQSGSATVAWSMSPGGAGPVVYSDNFDRADGALAAPWVSVEGSLVIASNKLSGPSGGPNVSHYNQTFAADQWAEADVAGTVEGGTCIGPAVRINGNDLVYLWFSNIPARVAIWQRIGGAYTPIATGPSPPTAFKARLEVEGTTYRAYVDGALVVSGTGDITTGRPGVLAANGAGATLDNWRAGDLPYPVGVFSDNFNRPDTIRWEDDGDGLGEEWIAPSWAINSNVAHRTGGNDFATFLHDLGTLDHWVEADITPNAYGGGGAGGFGCIEVRANGTNDTSAFLGFWAPDSRWVIGSTFGGYHDLVSVSSGGIPAFPIHLRFEAQGNTLNLYSGGALVLTYTDPSVNNGGNFTGMNAGGEPVVDNFRAGTFADVGGGGGAIGERDPKGVGTATWTTVAAAVGQRGAPKGAATVSYTENPVAAGKRTPKGSTSTGNFTYNPAAVGKKTPKATANTGNWTEVVAAVGKKAPKSTLTVVWLNTPAAVGYKVPKGAALTGNYLETVTGGGKRFPKGTITVAHSWIPAAVGVMPAVGMKQGAGTGQWTATLAAVGKRAPKATATTTYTEAVSVAGKKIQKATGTTSYLFSMLSGTPDTTLFSDTFNGTAGTPLTAFGYMGDGYAQMLKLDGAGNAVVQPPDTYSGVVRPEAFPTDCWAEFTFSVPVVPAVIRVYLEIRMPYQSWFHGYNMYLTNFDNGSSITLLRDDYGIGGISPGVITVQANVDHTARIEARGANFKLFFDGVLKVDYTDPAPLSGAGVVGPYHGIALDPSSSATLPSKDALKLKDYRIGGLGVAGGTTAIGKRTPKASATVPALQSIAATGKRDPKASGSVTWTYVQFAQGFTPVLGQKQGSAIVYSPWATAAIGKRTPKGGNLISNTWVLVVAGKKFQKAMCLTTWAEAVASAGKRVPKSTLITTYLEAVAAAGKRAPKGAAPAIIHTWTLAAQGTSPQVNQQKGTGVVNNTFAVAAVGKRSPKGSSTLGNVFVLAAAGKKLQRATATTNFQWSSAAVGKKFSDGTATPVIYQYATNAVGYREPKAIGDTDYWFSQVALGLSGITGQVEGLWNGEMVVAMQYGDKMVIDWLMIPS